MQWCSFTAEQNVSPVCLKARSWKRYIIVRQILVAIVRENDGLPHGMKTEIDSENSSNLYPFVASFSNTHLCQATRSDKKAQEEIGIKM